MSLAQEIKNKQKESLDTLINWFGNQKMTAHKLDVSKQVVSNWVARGRISAQMAVKAEAITGSSITKEELRPDVLEWL